MANSGVGNKFASVNLNRSYGQQQQHFNHHHHNNNQYGFSSGRGRNIGGGNGGGMVVLSRPRSLQKAAGPKLSVPPPLNLPSLRKEHEKFDSLGSGGSGGGVGNGPRPSSSGLGWTRPAVVVQEKEVEHVVDESGDSHGVGQGLGGSVSGVSKGGVNGSVYTPPSARVVMLAVSAASRGYSVPERATVLRGEDFPSLQAAMPATSGTEKKQKDGLNQKQKQVFREESANDQLNSSQTGFYVDMRPQSQSRNNGVTGYQEIASERCVSGGSSMYDKFRKQDDDPLGPLPLVRLNPRSDWADDERDIGHGLTDRSRDNGFSKSEAYWDTDFDFPRPSILPQKPGHTLFDRRGQGDNETGKHTSSEVTKVDAYTRETKVSTREIPEEKSWRTSSPLSRDGFGAQEVGNARNPAGMRLSLREVAKEKKHVASTFRDSIWEDPGRRDVGYGQVGRQSWNNKMDSFGSRGYEANNRERHGNEQYNRNRVDVYQSNSVSKSSFSLGGKGLPINDPILNFGRDKRSFSKSEKPYLEDLSSAPFDERDPFSGGFPALVKKKKDVLKQTDFHDPVRESFEAELEKVQKMQEQERQRASEEHDRAIELARREEEEKMRLAREQEEHQRRLEEERLDTFRRAEQERLDSMQRAEEQRIAREEEKRRMLMEEERRKQAAKQKLLELEERIAKRRAEAVKGGSTSFSGATNDKMSEMVAEKGVPKMPDMSEWEDGERMVERITTSASSDSSGMNRSLEMASRAQFPRDGSSSLLDRNKFVNSWKKDPFDNGNSSTFLPQDLENGHCSPRRDIALGGRTFPRKEFYGGPGFLPSRTYHKGGVPDPRMDDLSHIKGQRWNVSGDGEHYGRNVEMESEFHDNLTERFGDTGWGNNRPRGNPFPQYHEPVYQNPEADGIYSFGRSRYPMRQPRVLPPPAINPMLRNPYRPENDHPGPSILSENEMHYNHGARNESSVATQYDGSHQGNAVRAERIDSQQLQAENETHILDRSTARCDSQSSLSVSSPPDSPVHLSHDDLDESGDSPALSASEGKDITLLDQQNESTTLPVEADKENNSSVVSTGDDDEWSIENDQQLQEQEEYDEDEDGYEEEDEVHDGEDGNVDLMQNFDDMNIEEKNSSDMMDNLVLGFNEGVEVGMPNDEFERCSKNADTNFMIQQVSREEQESFDGVLSDGQAHQSAVGSDQLNINNSSRIFQGTEKVLQDVAIQPKHASQAPVASELSEHMEASCSSGLIQHQVPSSSTQNNVSSASSVGVQPEAPVNLQFGLFSGPSLIPSPVSAIQIGSIQMPLHLHAPVGPSITHMHSSQPPLFQFGQLRYTSPISQGVLPLAPQSVSFVQSNAPVKFPRNQNVGGSMAIQPGQDNSVVNHMKSDALPVSLDSQSGILPRNLDVSHSPVLKEGNSLPLTDSADNVVRMQQSQGESCRVSDLNFRPEPGFRSEDSFEKNFKGLSSKGLEGLTQSGAAPSQSVPKEKDTGASRGRGLLSGGRGRRYVFAVKNSGSKSLVQAADNSHQDSSGLLRPPRQRTEFRVREGSDKRQSSVFGLSSYGVDYKSNNSGRGSGSRNTSRRVVIPNRQLKQTFDSEGLHLRPVGSREADSVTKAERGAGKESLKKNQSISHSEEHVDAPLQSGIVRVFEQPGIEAPSDDDDFIEVRSKRQMLNDRREQREKEIKAKARVSKVTRKPRSTSQNMFARVPNKNAVVGIDPSNNVRADGHGSAKLVVSAGSDVPAASQPLPPIGTPALQTDTVADMRSQTLESFQTGPVPVVSGSGKNLATGLMFDSKNKVLDNPQTASLGAWGNSRINQQVLALTQTQLDEAMKPGQFDAHSAVGDSSISVTESSLPPPSILAKDKPFSSSSPINSLLAGEKIQFGAVTSPTILPPSSRAVSHGIGPPGPCCSDIQISHNLSADENQCSIFFEKEKHADESCAHVVDSDAEAAASAIAVAAISSDEIVGNEMGTGPVSCSDTKKYGGVDIDGLTTGVSGDQQLSGQSRAEESLSVALPADLSVDTPPIPLWPPLPSPPNSSSQMLSHVPGGTHSHFPFYEMNPMLGGPIYAFGPHDESASAQSQPQKSNTSVSGPLGTWQHHSGVDSFYGPPAGFTGPFISPSGSIPGVQGSPHMVVYNHFAPVGQFGQVGLSFMGTTYIPSGKQPDWKHNPASSAMGVGEGDMNNLNMVSAQRNSTNMPSPMQHLAPGSPLLPMGSPLAMFDVSPFQSAPDMSVQARWSHVPAPPLQSVPASMPLQQQAEGALPLQFGPSGDKPLPNRFPDSRTTTPSDKSHNFLAPVDSTMTRLPDELGLVDSSSSTTPSTLTRSVVVKGSSVLDAGKADGVQSGSGSNGQSTSSGFKAQPPHQKNTSSQHYNSSGYSYQKGGASQKNSSGGEWSHRRMGYQGRNQSMGTEKGYPSSKLKQIYVAKQTTSGTSAQS